MTVSVAGATPAPGTNPGMPAPALVPGTPPPAAAPAPVGQETVPAGGPPAVEPVVPAAPAAAPVEPVLTEEPKVEPVAPAAVQTFQSGNAIFDQAANLMSEKGVENVAGILKEAADGNLSIVSKAAMIEKLGETTANMVITSVEGEISTVRESGKAEGTKIKGYAAERFGATAEQADEVWTTMAAFARSEESGYAEEDRAALNGMLSKGGKTAEWAINEIASRYEQSQGFSRAPSLMQGDGKTQSGFEPLSKQDYVTQIRETVAKYGENSREVEALRNRRTKSLKRGF